jgi:hypothetical protein
MLKGNAPVVADSVVVAEPSIEVEPVVAVPEVQEQPTVDIPNEAPTPRPASSLSELIERHLKATGFGELDVLIANGTASATAPAFEVTLMARRPNLYKLKTESDQMDYMSQFGYDGQEGWFKQRLVDLSPEDIEFFMRVALFESSVPHLAWSFQSDEAREFGLDTVLERLPSEQWQGRPCEVVVSRGLLPFPMYHYIDQETNEEVYRRAQISRGAELVDVALGFDASEDAASPRIPMGYQLYIDGALHDTVRYTKIRANRTMLSSLFDAPSDAFATGLAPRR